MNRMLRGYRKQERGRITKTGYQDTWGIKMSPGSDPVSADLDVLDKCRVLSVQIPFLPLTVLFFLLFHEDGTDDAESVSSGIPLSDEGAGLF